MKTVGCKLFVVAALWLSLATSSGNTNEFRAYWVDVFHPGFLNSSQVTTLVDTMRAANCNAIVAEVRARANAYYNDSPYEPKGPGISPSTFDPLADLLAKGHDTSNGKQRLEIHAWLVTYKTSVAQPAAWMHKHNNGAISTTEYDPGHPEVQKRVYDVAMDITSRYDIDGLNFDYIRYPENTPLGPTEWGYNDVTVARFNARFGRTGKPAVSDPVWNQFRRDQVTALIRKIYLSVMAIKPHVKVSADTITWNPSPTSLTDWTNSARAYNDVLQDWRSWMEEGILDYSIPMNYYRQGALNYAADYMNWMNFAKDHQYDRQTIIGPGTYMNFATNVITQFRLVREPSPNGNYAHGICGFSYYFPSTNNIVPSTTMYQALVSPSVYDTNPVPVFAERATIPEMPWKTNPTKGHLKGFISAGHPTNLIDGATLSISGTMTRDFISDGTGFFGSANLLPGSYTLEASFPGFRPLTTNFTVTAGLVTTRDLVLEPYVITIIDQPQSQTVAIGANAQFNVNATGDTPLGYQWRFNGTNISGATASSHTVTNVQPFHAGAYSVVITNEFTAITSSNALLTVLTPPVITSQPQSQTVAPGGTMTLNVFATGAEPLGYQWRFNGSDIPGATMSGYTKSSLQTADSGNYSVIVQNSVGTTASSNALVIVVAQPNFVFSNLWNIPAGSRAYVTTANTERGLAINTATDHVLILSRSSEIPDGLGIFILDAQNGQEIGTMSITGTDNAATFRLNKIDVANDGVIYAANLTTAISTAPLIIYRWENENAVPTVAYSGVPAGSITPRWGDNFVVRGSGINTEILVSGSSTTTNVIVLNTTDGVSFTARQLTPQFVVNGGEFSKGLAWGAGNSFYSKRNVDSFGRNCSFGPVATTISQTADLSPLHTMMVAICVATNHNLLFGLIDDNTTSPTGHRLSVHDLANVDTAIATFPFPPNTDGYYTNNSNFAGAIDTDGKRVFALDTQNGVIALKVGTLFRPTIESLAIHEGPGVHLQLDIIPDGLTIEGSSDLLGWEPLTNFIVTNGVIEVMDPGTNSPQRFYRSRTE